MVWSPFLIEDSKILLQRTGNILRDTEKTRHVQVKENKDHQILDTLDAEAGHKMVLIVAPRPKALNEFRNLLSASVAVSGIMHFLALSWCGHGEGPMATWRQYEGIKPMGGAQGTFKPFPHPAAPQA